MSFGVSDCDSLTDCFRLSNSVGTRIKRIKLNFRFHILQVQLRLGVERECTQSDRTTEPGYKHLQSLPLKNTPKDLSAVT